MATTQRKTCCRGYGGHIHVINMKCISLMGIATSNYLSSYMTAGIIILRVPTWTWW